MAKKTSADENVKAVTIAAPNFETAIFLIRGTTPYVQLRFSEKAQKIIRTKQKAGSKAKNTTKKKPKDFQQCYRDAMYQTGGRWRGIPAAAFRCGMISACRVAGFQMTKAKLSVFVDADGFDAKNGTPLVRIRKGKPHYVESPVSIKGTMDLRVRAMWDAGWEARVRVSYDADQFSLEDISNLMMRVGRQVGIGEGRPDGRSSKSFGMGWGFFELLGKEKDK